MAESSPTLINRLWNWFKSLIAKITGLKDTPHSVALGVAIGMFWGFSPLWGLKTVLTLAIAWVLRANRIAAVITVSLHDVLIPVAPFVLTAQFYVGEKILGRHSVLPSLGHHPHIKLHEMMSWTTFLGVGAPLLIGALVTGCIVSPIAYWITLKSLARIEKRRAARHMSHVEPKF